MIMEKLTRADRPPLGVIPKFILEERRFNELKEAIERFTAANWPIPNEIISEYNDMASRLQKSGTVNQSAEQRSDRK